MLTLEGNTNYNLTLQQDKQEDGTITLTLSFKPVSKVELAGTVNVSTETSTTTSFKTMEDVATVLNSTPQTPLSQTKSPEEVKETVAGAISTLGQLPTTQPMWGQPTTQLTPAVGHPLPQQSTVSTLPNMSPVVGLPVQSHTITVNEMPPQTHQVAPQQSWGLPVQQPTLPIQQSQWGTPQPQQPMQQEQVITVTMPVTLPTQNTLPAQTVVTQEQQVIAEQEQVVKEEKTKRSRAKKDKDLEKEENVTVYGSITIHQTPDGSATFKKGEELLMLQHPKNGDFVPVEIYPPMYQALTEVLTKYNAAGDVEKNCGVLQVPESVIASEILPHILAA